MKDNNTTGQTYEKKIQTKVIALDEPNTLRERLGCSEWVNTEHITLMNYIGNKDILLLKGLAHSSLKHIDLQDAKIDILPPASFKECNALESIILPACNTIPTLLFENCKKLHTISLSPFTNSIEDFAFSNCSALEQIELTSNVSLLGKKIFMNCTSLKRVFINNPYPPVCAEDSLNGIPNDTYFFIPTGCLEKYKADNTWRNLNLIEVNKWKEITI